VNIENQTTDENSYTWECPVCGRTNCGAHYSHESPCECKKYRHPRLQLNQPTFDSERERNRMKEIYKLLKDYDKLDSEIFVLKRDQDAIEDRLKELGY